MHDFQNSLYQTGSNAAQYTISSPEQSINCCSERETRRCRPLTIAYCPSMAPLAANDQQAPQLPWIDKTKSSVNVTQLYTHLVFDACYNSSCPPIDTFRNFNLSWYWHQCWIIVRSWSSPAQVHPGKLIVLLCTKQTLMITVIMLYWINLLDLQTCSF